MDGTLTGATTQGSSGTGSNGNEEVLYILQISMNKTSPSYFLMSFKEHSAEGGSYLSAEMQSVYLL